MAPRKKFTLFLPWVFLLSLTFSQVADVGAADTYYSQKIQYVVENASEGYIVWGINGWQHTDKAFWKEGTTINRKLLVTPLRYVDDSILQTEINVPLGATIDFSFWITKDRDGLFNDIWDPKKYHVKAENTGPILIKGNFDLPKIRRKWNVLDHGWKLLLLFVLSLGGGIFIIRFFQLKALPLTYNQKIILVSISLYIFHFLSRLSILGISPRKLSYSSLGIGSSDLIFVSILAGSFLLLGLFLRKPRSRHRLWCSFYALASLSLVAALLNISVVEKLGHPFNYPWLYYSDFLVSMEAQSAMAANASWTIVGNISALWAAMVLLAWLMMEGLRVTNRVKGLSPTVFAIIFTLGVLTLITGFSSPVARTDDGKRVHPVSAFLLSLGNAESQTNFFSLKVPEQYRRSHLPHPSVVRTFESVENLVLIVLESAGAQYFDLYGGQYQITPFLNNNLAHAVLFENIYAHAPSTNKSLVSLLCSIYPMVSYQSLTQERPDFQHPCLASELARLGYRTSFFTSSNLSYQGAAKFLSYRSFESVEDYREIACEQQFQLRGGDEGFNAAIDDACLVPRLAAWLDRDRTRPFFSMLWTNQGHYPYFLNAKEQNFEVADVYFNRYLNVIRHYDEIIGALIDSLRERNLFDSTLVAVVGDHGQAFGQHGQYGHAGGIYEENLRVPLILINPRLFWGKRKSVLGGLIDLAPTFLHLANKAIPAEWQGRSLFLADREQEVFFFAPWSKYLFGGRQGNLKFIFNETDNRVELYDLANDPLETRNVALKYPEQVQDFRLKLAAWMQQQKARW